MKKDYDVMRLLGYEGGLAGPTDPSVAEGCIDAIADELYVLEEHEGKGGISERLAEQAAHAVGVKAYTLSRSLGFERPEDVSVLEGGRVDYRRLFGLVMFAYASRP